MSNTRQLKGQLKSLKSLQKILKALEIVSTIKLQKLKKKTDLLKSFLHDFLNVLSVLGDQINIFDFDHNNWDPNGKRLIVVIGTDKGLCGAINSKILKHISTKYGHIKDKVDVFVVGKKALEFFVRDGRNIVGALHIKDNFTEEDLNGLFVFIKESLKEKKYAKIKVYFNYFKNTMTQIPLRFKIFPLDKESFDMFLQDIGINFDKISKKSNGSLLIEPSKSEIKYKLMQEIIKYIVYGAVLQNKTGEHAARMFAMKNAKDNSGEIIKSVNILYNKIRQTKITQEISEIGNAKAAIEQSQ